MLPPSRQQTNEPPTIEPVHKNNKDDNELYEKITKEIVQKEIVPYLEIKDIDHLTSIDTKINAKGDITEPIKGTVICNNMKDFENIHKKFPNATIKVRIESGRDNNVLRNITGYCFYLEGFKGAAEGDACNHQVSLLKDGEWKVIEHFIYLNNDETPKYILKGTKEKPIKYTGYSGIFGNKITQCISYEVNNYDSQYLYEANEGGSLEIDFIISIFPITNDGKLVIHKYGGRVTNELHGDEINPVFVNIHSKVIHAKSYKHELDGRVYHYIGNVVFHDSVE